MKMSTLITKTRKDISSQEASINAQLLERAGYISKLMAGVYSFLPLGFRVLNNIENIIKEEMDAVGGQELLMPALQPKEIWETTGRWDKVDVLYKLKAHDKELCLGPTHEEVVTPLVAEYIQSYKDLPKSVYQIQTKYRAEARPKSGLLRGREFRMKDLYSFHTTQEDLDNFYEEVTQAYKKIFNRLGLGHLTYLTYASGGIFSKYSHEFQTLTPYGEDLIYACYDCNIAINKEIIAEQNSCPKCAKTDLVENKSIEVGNIFKLGTRFSESCRLTYADSDGKVKNPIMGCYGMGSSRIMGAIVEVLHDESGIIWPEEVAPYKIHLISLGKDLNQQANDLYNKIKNAGISVIFDDRDVQAGTKFADADLLGMPLRIVLSNKTLAQNSVEVKERNKKESRLISLDNLFEAIK